MPRSKGYANDTSSCKSLEALIDEFCDLHLEGGRVPQRRGKLSSGRDWTSEFRRAIGECDDPSRIEVEIPMLDKWSLIGGRLPYGAGSQYWTDYDNDVFSILRLSGVRFKFPEQHSGEYFSDDLVWFFLFCPPGFAEPLFEDHRINLDSVDFSYGIMNITTTDALLISGNDHAFRWLVKNKAESLSMSRFKIPELVDTPLLIPLIEEKADGSLRAPALYEGLKGLIAHRKWTWAIALASKLKLTEARTKELISLAKEVQLEEDEGGAELVASLEERLSTFTADRKPKKGRAKKPLVWNAKRINEFVSFANHGDIAAMTEYLNDVGGGGLPNDGPLDQWNEGVPRAHFRLWEACAANCDVELLDYLLERGLDLQAVANAHGFTVIESVNVLSASSKTKEPQKDGAMRAFLLKILDSGVKYENTSVDDVETLLRHFSGDYELFDKLYDAGLPFHYEDEFEEGDTDAHTIWKMVVGSRAYKVNWGDAAYFLSHGAVLKGSSAFANEVWLAIEAHPVEAAEIIVAAAPNSIEPVERLLPLVAASGNIDACRALELWDGAYTEGSIDIAIDKATDEGHTEIIAYLADKSSKGTACG